MKSDDVVPVEKWQRIWRDVVVPLLSTNSLVALRDALAVDDPRLVQRRTIEPALSYFRQKEPVRVRAACILGYCGWKGENLETTYEVTVFIADLWRKIDKRTGSPESCRVLLETFDGWSRRTLLETMLPEVERAIQQRTG